MRHRRLALALVLLSALNVADLLLTLAVFELGGGEGNPILAAAWERGMPSFVAAKVALAGFGISMLWACREEEISRIGVTICCAVYLCVIGVHIKVIVELTK